MVGVHSWMVEYKVKLRWVGCFPSEGWLIFRYKPCTPQVRVSSDWHCTIRPNACLGESGALRPVDSLCTIYGYHRTKRASPVIGGAGMKGGRACSGMLQSAGWWCACSEFNKECRSEIYGILYVHTEYFASAKDR